MDINRKYTIKEIKGLSTLELAELKSMSGIYMIENINNHKVYIGHASHIGERWKQHIGMLEKNTHHSHTLQTAYNLIRKNNRDVKFIFSIVELTSKEKEDLFLREKYWINYYDSLYNGYNDADVGEFLTKKLINSKKNKENAKEYYKIFDEIYDPDRVYFGSLFLPRIKSKKYSAGTIKRICTLVLWFINNYNNTDYIGKFGYGISKELRVMIYDGVDFIDDYTYNGKRIKSFLIAEINNIECIEFNISFEEEYNKYKLIKNKEY